MQDLFSCLCVQGESARKGSYYLPCGAQSKSWQWNEVLTITISTLLCLRASVQAEILTNVCIKLSPTRPMHKAHPTLPGECTALLACAMVDSWTQKWCSFPKQNSAANIRDSTRRKETSHHLPLSMPGRNPEQHWCHNQWQFDDNTSISTKEICNKIERHR